MARAAPESRQQARSALAGDLSWGRLGRIALLQDTSEIFPKSLPEACRDLPELILALLGLILTLLGVICGFLGLMLGLLGVMLGLLGRSWALLGRSCSKTLQNRSRRLSRRPPAPELDLGSILGHFGSILGPPGPQKTWFSCGGCVIFRKNDGFGKTP